jgi:hypothetical protein
MNRLILACTGKLNLAKSASAYRQADDIGRRQQHGKHLIENPQLGSKVVASPVCLCPGRQRDISSSRWTLRSMKHTSDMGSKIAPTSPLPQCHG